MRSLLQPQSAMGKIETIFLILLAVSWCVWSVFSVNESWNPALEGIFRCLSAGLLMLGFWCYLLGVKAMEDERPVAYRLCGLGMALSFLLGCPLMMNLLFAQSSIPVRLTGLFLCFCLINGVILWCVINFCRIVAERKSKWSTLTGILGFIALFFLGFAGGGQFCALLYFLLRQDWKKRDKIQLAGFLAAGSLLFWVAVWLGGAGFLWLPERGIRYEFFGFWIVGYAIAIILNLFMIWPLLFVWLKRWSWTLAWGAMLLFSFALLGWAAYENRPERYCQAEFGTLPESVHLEGMKVTQLLDRHGGGAFYLLQGEGVTEFAQTLIRRLNLKEQELTTQYFVPESMRGGLPPELAGWSGSRTKSNDKLYLDREKNRLYYFRVN